MFKALKKCEALRTLALSSCVCLDNSTFHAIGTRTSLTTLKLEGDFPIVSAVALQQIAQLVNLETLVIRKNYLLTDKLLCLLAANCKKLSRLDMCGEKQFIDFSFQFMSLSRVPNNVL